MSVKSAFYIDRMKREVLYIPFVAVVIGNIVEPEVIFGYRKLRRRQQDWKVGRTSIEGDVRGVYISGVDIKNITGLCHEGKVAEARGYCIDLFDLVANQVCGLNSLEGCEQCR